MSLASFHLKRLVLHTAPGVMAHIAMADAELEIAEAESKVDTQSVVASGDAMPTALRSPLQPSPVLKGRKYSLGRRNSGLNLKNLPDNKVPALP